ncbi:hypothetical protein ABZV58_03300 [Nocardia sp. NPDC004654]|uniref:hypothetical protein n=1 Tax=Nocardia sp. NPDC004654 TaxID=3154776 RepID=UPI0033A6CB48
MRLPDTSHLRAGWKLVRIPMILFALYLALHPVLAALSARHGFGSPDGLGLAFLTVSAVVVTLRIVLLVVVPAVLAYRVVVWAVMRMLRRGVSPTPTSAAESNVRGFAGRFVYDLTRTAARSQDRKCPRQHRLRAAGAPSTAHRDRWPATRNRPRSPG